MEEIPPILSTCRLRYISARERAEPPQPWIETQSFGLLIGILFKQETPWAHICVYNQTNDFANVKIETNRDKGKKKENNKKLLLQKKISVLWSII